MGDRCYVTVTLRQDDMPRFNKILGEDWYTDQDSADKTAVTVFIEEANYGFEGELEDLAEAGMTFIATNSAGSGYGNGETISYKGDSLYIPTTFDGEPYIRFYESGPDRNDVVTMANYYNIVHKIEQYFKKETGKMSVDSYEALKHHVGHEVKCVAYGSYGKLPENVSVECLTCGTVLMDFDRPEKAETRDPEERRMDAQDAGGAVNAD